MTSYNQGITSGDEINSTTLPLGSGATFTGKWELNDYQQAGVMVKTDNSGTLYFDFSNDGTNADSTFPVNGFGISSGISAFHTAVKLGRYFRVRFVNDSGAQSYIRLKTYYGNNFVPSVAPLNQTAGLDQDAIFVRGTVAYDEIALGRRSGVTKWNKFGYNLDVDSASPEVIASFGGTFTPLDSAETFDIAYDGTAGGSTDGAGTTGATELTIYYIDSSGLPATATHTLGTDGTDTTAFTGLGINRVAVSASGTNNTNASDITITATTAGTNQAQIPAGTGVTQQCIFFNGSNHRANAKQLVLNIRKLSGGTAPRVTLRGWVYNRAIATKFLIFTHKIDTNVENSFVLNTELGFSLNEADVLWFEAETNTNDTAVNGRFDLVMYQNT